ncbi:hypothetical protein LOTGIDRAFT_158497 [Lottia gigantea]|uniref:Uncharacterized protein n=1 Tax=Lottia gigantea TaxID=225164 RepID=V4CC22_LOTGI|nr:hypothetical protein LOTGIDRAFT_158497 [Lottia gigantea]ESO99409.1 hypothetical protein LOTGIDRAFT_158497 [Lottia gigantea]
MEQKIREDKARLNLKLLEEQLQIGEDLAVAEAAERVLENIEIRDVVSRHSASYQPQPKGEDRLPRSRGFCEPKKQDRIVEREALKPVRQSEEPVNKRWCSKATEMKSKEKSVRFSHLVDFIRNESMKANDAIFGKEAIMKLAEKKKPVDKKKHVTASYNRNKASYATDLKSKEDRLKKKSVAPVSRTNDRMVVMKDG